MLGRAGREDSLQRGQGFRKAPEPLPFQAPAQSPAPVFPLGGWALPHASSIPTCHVRIPLSAAGEGGVSAFAGGDNMVGKPHLLA